MVRVQLSGVAGPVDASITILSPKPLRSLIKGRRELGKTKLSLGKTRSSLSYTDRRVRRADSNC